MPWQLIYTSAPRLLTAGQTGFGTVARDRDMPPLVVSAAERFSQFARLPGMDAARVVYCHRAVDAAGARHHVLSRIASAGADYTGRTNHLAHHVILTAAEAAALAAQGVTAADVVVRFPWRATWDEAPRWLGANECPDLATLPHDPHEHLSLWAEATGNPGHALHLLSGPGLRSGSIVVAPAKWQLRRLYAEALSHVRDQGWQFTFTTELDPGDSPGDFRWLGFSTGSPVLSTAQAGRRFLVDLTRPTTLPTPEPLPEKQKAAAPSSPQGKRLAPPRVAAPVGGAFVEPPVELPPPLCAQKPKTGLASLLRHRAPDVEEGREGHDALHGWRIVGIVLLSALGVLGVVLLASGKWRSTSARRPAASARSDYYFPSAGLSPQSPPASTVPESSSPPGPTLAPSALVPPSVAPSTSARPAAPAAATRSLVPCRAAHFAQLEQVELPGLAVQQTHWLVTGRGEERGPLLEVRGQLFVSPKDASPVLKLDYAAHRASWTAGAQVSVSAPVQWQVVDESGEVLRVLIGDGTQDRPVNAAQVSAQQDESGAFGGVFGQLAARFGAQALWLRLPAETATMLRDCGYPGPPFVPLRQLKADPSDLVAWVVKEQAKSDETIHSPMAGQDASAFQAPPVDSGFSTSPTPRSKQTNTLENRPPPSSSVAGAMEQMQQQRRSAAQKRFDLLARLRGSAPLLGRLDESVCSFFAGPAGSAPADAVWICDVAVAPMVKP